VPYFISMEKLIDFTQLQRKKAYDFWYKTRLEYQFRLREDKSYRLYQLMEVLDYILEYNYRDFHIIDESPEVREQKLKELSVHILGIPCLVGFLGDDGVVPPSLLEKLNRETNYPLPVPDHEDYEPWNGEDERHVYLTKRLQRMKEKQAKRQFIITDTNVPCRQDAQDPP
jgi:hypothetical protein